MGMKKKFGFLRFFPPAGRHGYLDPATVKRLVIEMRLDKDIYAWLERKGHSWRLRVSYKISGKSRTRRGITLPDEKTADWVLAHLKKARGQKSSSAARKTA